MIKKSIIFFFLIILGNFEFIFSYKDKDLEDLKSGYYYLNYKNFRIACLCGMKLRNKNFHSSDFWYCCAKKTHFQGSDLSGADFRIATLTEAHFETLSSCKNKTNLCRTNFREAKLSGAFLIYVNAKKANFGKATLICTNLMSSDFQEARFEESNLIGANMKNSNFEKTKFEKSHLGGANLTDSNFKESNLQQANLSGTNLTNANFKKANLVNADLTGANLTNTNFRKANLENAILEGCIIKDTDFELATGLSNKQKYYLRENGAKNVPPYIFYGITTREKLDIGFESKKGKSCFKKFYDSLFGKKRQNNVAVQTD